MTKVAVTKAKLDALAEKIGIKSKRRLPLTIDEMGEAVDSIELYVEPALQAKSVSPSESVQTIQPDSGYDGLSEVSVGAISDTYVGTGITRRSSSSLTASGATVTAPAGYYSSTASKSVSSMTLPSGTTTTSSGTKKSDVKSFVSASTDTYKYLNIPIGYNGTAQHYRVLPVVADGIEATENRTFYPGDYDLDGFSAVTVNVPTGTARTSSDLTVSGATVTAPAGLYASDASAIVASGTEGTPTATKGTVSNHSVSVTPSVTNTTGYITGGTKTGTAVTVSASELVDGIYAVNSSGTKDVTNYASASVAAGSATASATKGSVSNHSVTVTPSVTRTAGWVTAGSTNGTAVTVTASELASGNKEITANGTGIDVVGYSTVSVDVSGGGGSDVQVGYSDVVDIPSATSTISFTELKGEPTSFIVYYNADLSTPSGTPYKIAALVYDGTDIHGQTITNTSNAQVTYDGSSFSESYSNGTLTLSSTGAYFQPGDYYLTYTYGGISGNIKTSDVQVGSGATSITFDDLEDEPLCWYLIFKSNFGTSSGYQRVIFVTDNDGCLGMAMDSSAHNIGSWTASYSNGSFTITSTGTNNGGYFHQPGYYQLTYAIAGDGGNYQSKTVTPTTSQQVVQADSGYDALKKVTVNAIPNTYVQPTSTVGATTYRASTSAQTIQSGTYHSAAATIAAVSQTNLSAENIKSGTTITISNGQSNLWSVTGSYTGGGGSATVATATATATGRPTSLSFTVSGQPKAFFVRCTSAMSRSSNSSYYYVADMRYNGTNTTGNCWRMSNGNWTNITSGYSFTYSGTTLTVSSSGTSTTSPGSFYNNGSYECVYVY